MPQYWNKSIRYNSIKFDDGLRWLYYYVYRSNTFLVTTTADNDDVFVIFLLAYVTLAVLNKLLFTFDVFDIRIYLNQF